MNVYPKEGKGKPTCLYRTTRALHSALPNQVRCFYLSQRRKNCKQNLVSYETSALTVETIEKLPVRKISHHASCWRRKHHEILERNPTCSPLKTESSIDAG
jgi:hypothetical protein